jgi:deoxyribodipyrimidine photo-lyase
MPKDRMTSSGDAPVLVVFRHDLRLSDNPALAAAAETGRPLAALFVLDEMSPGIRPLGGAARWWLDGSLRALAAQLATRGVPLTLQCGGMAERVVTAAQALGAADVVWTRRYAAAEQAADARMKSELARLGIGAHSFNGTLIIEPWEVRNGAGQPFRVFTPFWRAVRASSPVRALAEAVPTLRPHPRPLPSEDLDTWRLTPTTPDWAGGMRAAWTPGEAGALASVDRFLRDVLPGYAERRDRPDLLSTSRLSPHLRFGELSPVRLWHGTRTAIEAGATPAAESDIEKFLSEIGWREFAYHLLGQFPALAMAHFQPRFDAFPWRDDRMALNAWQKGRTGYPIVDAGMRELWHTGWMHNRVRMIVASFLVKHLLIDWRRGEEWFWDTLVDADPASNAASWQWVAGSGADAAPFFRILNPVLQGEKFDPQGAYVRRWVPELAALPDATLHRPWTAGELTLRDAGIVLGRTYPRPIVDHDHARARALAALRNIR